MTIIFRNNGPWGAGKLSNLTSMEVDENFWDHEERIVELETNPPAPVEISNIELVGTQLTIYMDNGDEYGPYTVPQANFRPSVVRDEEFATDGTYTPTLSDINAYLRFSDAGTFIIPSNAEVAFPVDTEITVRQASSGAITFETPTDVILNGLLGFLDETAFQGATVTIKKIATDEWDIMGLLAEDATA